MSRLEGRTAVVTGASRGIGAAVAELFAAEGARVIRIARSLKPASRGAVQDLTCDLTDADQVSRLAADILSRQGVPDIVVSNAGAFLLRPLETTTAAELELQLAVNLKAPFAVAKAFLPAMQESGRGSFITVGSVADHTAYAENAAYAASKYGLRGLHDTLVAEFHGTGVRLTLVSPGATDTTIWDPFAPERRPGFPPRAAMLRPEDVADAVLFAATRPEHVHVDWIRLQPTGRPATITNPTPR
ncbi:MAG TPA: SDR family oxidoreductase [Gemmatimonadales bacterium]|nr:SDR family oxidoreductase [Gemmatimonadales bacterium]